MPRPVSVPSSAAVQPVAEVTLDPAYPKGRLSHSSVSLYLSCPMAYYLQYVEKVPSLTTPPLIEGSAVHEVLEANNLHKQAKGDDLPVERITERWNDVWSQAVKDGKDVKFDEDSPDSIRARGKGLLEHYRKFAAPRISPPAKDGIEEEFLVATPNGTPVIGYIDLVDVGGKLPTVIDYKVAGRAKSESTAETCLQLGLYAFAKKNPFVGFISLVKGRTPSVTQTRVQRTESSVRRTLNVVEQVGAAIKKGAFPFTDPESWKCQVKYCGVWHACPQGGKGVAAQRSFFV